MQLAHACLFFLRSHSIVCWRMLVSGNYLNQTLSTMWIIVVCFEPQWSIDCTFTVWSIDCTFTVRRNEVNGKKTNRICFFLRLFQSQHAFVNHRTPRSESKTDTTKSGAREVIRGSSGPVNFGRSSQAAALTTMSVVIGLVSSAYTACVLGRQTVELVVNVPRALHIGNLHIC